MLNLQQPATYRSVIVVLLLVRCLGAFLLPGRAYTQFEQQDPKTYLGATAYDFVLFLSILGVWRVRPRLELAAASCLALCLGLMAHWHREAMAGGDTLLGPKVLLLRLAAGLGYLALARAMQGAARRCQRGSSTSEGAVEVAKKACDGTHEDGAVLEASSAAQVPGKPVVQLAAGPSHGSARAYALEMSVKGGETSSSESDPDRVGEAAGSHRPAGDARHEAPGTATAIPAQALDSGGAGAPGPAVLKPDAQAAAAAAARPELGPDMQQRRMGSYATALAICRAAALTQMSYTSPLEHQTLSFKIPGVEPEQVAPGYEARVCEALERQGVLPLSVSVRRGCVKLTVVTRALRKAPGKTVEDARGGKDAAKGRGGPAPLRLDAPTVVQVLGLEAPEGYTGGRDQWLSAVRCHAPEVLGSEARDWMALGPARIAHLSAWALHVPGPADGAREWAAPELRVVLACPRRGQRGCSEGAEAEAGAAAAAGLGAEALPLTACLSWGNTFLPVRVTPVGDVAAAEGGEGQQMVEYALQLPCQPPCPGVVLLELSVGDPDAADGSGQRVPGARTHTTLPLLATDDAAVAAEVAALAECWPRGDMSSLTDLLLDMGTWAAGPPADAAEGGYGSVAYSQEAACWLAAAKGVLEFTRAVGCTAIAARISADITAYGQRPMGDAAKAGLPKGGCASANGSHPALAKGQEAPARLLAHTPSSAGSPNAWPLREWLEAAAWVMRTEAGLGGAGRSGAAELEASHAQLARWSVPLSQCLVVVEALGAAACVHRAGALLPWHVVPCILLALIPGVATALGPLLLPPPAGERLAQAMRAPRVLLTALAKALCGPSLRAFNTASAQAPLVALSNGLLLPLAGPVPLRTMALLSALRLPANASLLLAVGATARPVHAVLLAALVEALALTTTLLCQTHMRLAGRREAERGHARAVASVSGAKKLE
ncbi:hypothetical protein HYH03_010528 [Edaphochlamys debaryana]|uniref:Uncharacterized protein n=1 Tax=Edaphochlamys debaryana TaxID=47281 RepID=A0A835XWG1_9CHLO|nr:hypothetical protein HYH03_010528 [Edaphochlamys debaryana]|eukprot:KAG2491084.1 hypothetical protein HYH03_010528 [Edaphochlamys debaryana]